MFFFVCWLQVLLKRALQPFLLASLQLLSPLQLLLPLWVLDTLLLWVVVRMKVQAGAVRCICVP